MVARIGVRQSSTASPVPDERRRSKPETTLSRLQAAFGNRSLMQFLDRSAGARDGSALGQPLATEADPLQQQPLQQPPLQQPTTGNTEGATGKGACLVNAALPYARSGILRGGLGTVGESFEVRVEWRDAPPISGGEASSYCAAECGEYHQFVMGHALSSVNADGSDLKDVSAKVFGGLPLDPGVFREDGLDGNPNARYGHRDEKPTMNEQYEPTRATGTKYVGKDFPYVSTGTYADIDLTFRGDVVDKCNQTVLASNTWQVQYRGIIRP